MELTTYLLRSTSSNSGTIDAVLEKLGIGEIEVAAVVDEKRDLVVRRLEGSSEPREDSSKSESSYTSSANSSL